MTMPTVETLETLLREHAYMWRNGMAKSLCFADDWEGAPLGFPEPDDYVPHARHVAQLIVALYETPELVPEAVETVSVQLFQQWRADRTNPDCVQGKHSSCAGDAWDNTLDERIDCMCGCGHPRAQK